MTSKDEFIHTLEQKCYDAQNRAYQCELTFEKYYSNFRGVFKKCFDVEQPDINN